MAFPYLIRMDGFPFAAVCFDFDGTLADSFDPIAASVNHVRGLHGFAPLSVAEVKVHVGHGPEHLLAHTVPGCRLPEDVLAYRAHHPSVMFEKTMLLPGASEAMASLHEAGRKLGLCSNKPSIFSRQLLRHLGVDHRFAVVLGPEDVARPKPAPDMLIAAIERLGVRVEETLYVGDMVVDIQTARAAGVTVWVAPTGSQSREDLEAANPDRMLASLHELAWLI